MLHIVHVSKGASFLSSTTTGLWGFGVVGWGGFGFGFRLRHKVKYYRSTSKSMWRQRHLSLTVSPHNPPCDCPTLLHRQISTISELPYYVTVLLSFPSSRSLPSHSYPLSNHSHFYFFLYIKRNSNICKVIGHIFVTIVQISCLTNIVGKKIILIVDLYKNQKKKFVNSIIARNIVKFFGLYSIALQSKSNSFLTCLMRIYIQLIDYYCLNL